jgi:hypothetical protein
VLCGNRAAVLFGQLRCDPLLSAATGHPYWSSGKANGPPGPKSVVFAGVRERNGNQNERENSSLALAIITFIRFNSARLHLRTVLELGSDGSSSGPSSRVASVSMVDTARWKATATGQQYEDKSGSSGGITKVKITAALGTASIRVNGLGHAQIHITLDTYSHVLPSMQKDAAASAVAPPAESSAPAKASSLPPPD